MNFDRIDNIDSTEFEEIEDKNYRNSFDHKDSRLDTT